MVVLAIPVESTLTVKLNVGGVAMVGNGTWDSVRRPK